MLEALGHQARAELPEVNPIDVAHEHRRQRCDEPRRTARQRRRDRLVDARRISRRAPTWCRRAIATGSALGSGSAPIRCSCSARCAASELRRAPGCGEWPGGVVKSAKAVSKDDAGRVPRSGSSRAARGHRGQPRERRVRPPNANDPAVAPEGRRTIPAKPGLRHCLHRDRDRIAGARSRARCHSPARPGWRAPHPTRWSIRG